MALIHEGGRPHTAASHGPSLRGSLAECGKQCARRRHWNAAIARLDATDARPARLAAGGVRHRGRSTFTLARLRTREAVGELVTLINPAMPDIVAVIGDLANGPLDYFGWCRPNFEPRPGRSICAGVPAGGSARRHPRGDRDGMGDRDRLRFCAHRHRCRPNLEAFEQRERCASETESKRQLCRTNRARQSRRCSEPAPVCTCCPRRRGIGSSSRNRTPRSDISARSNA
jgi:hypothetical protein